MTRIPLDHPLLDDADRAMQRFADECLRRGVGRSFQWNTGRRWQVVKVEAIEDSVIRFSVRGFAGVMDVPREPARAALAAKTLQARAGQSPN